MKNFKILLTMLLLPLISYAQSPISESNKKQLEEISKIEKQLEEASKSLINIKKTLEANVKDNNKKENIYGYINYKKTPSVKIYDKDKKLIENKEYTKANSNSKIKTKSSGIKKIKELSKKKLADTTKKDIDAPDDIRYAMIEVDSILINIKKNQITRTILFYKDNVTIINKTMNFDELNNDSTYFEINYDSKLSYIKSNNLLTFIPLNNEDNVVSTTITLSKKENTKELLTK